MASKKTWGITVLLLRLLTLASLVVSIILIATDNVTFAGGAKLHFKDFHAYRYVLSVAVIGAAYTLIQILIASYYVQNGKHLVRDDHAVLFLHFADLVIALLLATGVGVGYGFTVEEKRMFGDGNNDLDKFLDMALISTSFLLLATLCMGALILMKK
ncbi:hypothetical protein J5N97_005908 [Dioscorea zingiberensis]|uniref:CASP-like protein n=1 Tax=Dioscorea zingiberensis TaxID=325984 RepID=A0A9D5DBH3_9LILI|nr:hypothetical protein J5N97_005908 [Dioscorea zingiberensis]